MNRQVLMFGLLVLVAASAGALFWYRSGTTVPEVTRIDLFGVCLACGQEVTTQYPPTETAPRSCPHCQKLAVYPWFLCDECEHRFVPPPEPAPAGQPHPMPRTAVCPNCNRSGASPWDPGLASITKGDRALPAWPPK
jgi:hypothetical protein